MPHALTYDTQPPHSRVRREIEAGVLKLTILPEEPGPVIRRLILFRSAIPAALICCGVLLLCLAVFGGLFLTNRRGFSIELMLTLVLAFIIFCIALFAFIWRIQYYTHLDRCRTALKQTTLIAASIGRLIIESAGPGGSASHDLHDVQAIVRNGDRIQIVRNQGPAISILHERDPAELSWIARALSAALNLPNTP